MSVCGVCFGDVDSDFSISIVNTKRLYSLQSAYGHCNNKKFTPPFLVVNTELCKGISNVIPSFKCRMS